MLHVESNFAPIVKRLLILYIIKLKYYYRSFVPWRMHLKLCIISYCAFFGQRIMQ